MNLTQMKLLCVMRNMMIHAIQCQYQNPYMTTMCSSQSITGRQNQRTPRGINPIQHDREFDYFQIQSDMSRKPSSSAGNSSSAFHSTRRSLKPPSTSIPVLDPRPFSLATSALTQSIRSRPVAVQIGGHRSGESRRGGVCDSASAFASGTECSVCADSDRPLRTNPPPPQSCEERLDRPVVSTAASPDIELFVLGNRLWN
jgi:hypothetical protein